MSKMMGFLLFITLSAEAKNEAIVLGSSCQIDEVTKSDHERIQWDLKKSQSDMADGLAMNGWKVKNNFISGLAPSQTQKSTSAEAKTWMKTEMRKSYCDSEASQLLIAFNAHGSEKNPFTGKSDHSICLFKSPDHHVKDDPGRLYMSEVKQWITDWQKDPACKSKPQLAIIDRSCHSGGAAEELGDVACVITATTNDVAAAGDNGIFQDIADLLRSPSDAQRANLLSPDASVTMDEAFLYSLLNPGPGSSQLKNQPQFSGCLDSNIEAMKNQDSPPPVCDSYINQQASLDFLTDHLYPWIENKAHKLLLEKISLVPIPDGEEIKEKLTQEYKTRLTKTKEYEALCSGEESNLVGLNKLLTVQPPPRYSIPLNLDQMQGLTPSGKSCLGAIKGSLLKKLTKDEASHSWSISGSQIADLGLLNAEGWNKFGSDLMMNSQTTKSSACTDADTKSISQALGGYLHKQSTDAFNQAFPPHSSVRINIEQARKQNVELSDVGQHSYNQLLREARAYGLLECMKKPSPALKKCQSFKLKEN